MIRLGAQQSALPATLPPGKTATGRLNIRIMGDAYPSPLLKHASERQLNSSPQPKFAILFRGCLFRARLRLDKATRQLRCASREGEMMVPRIVVLEKKISRGSSKD